jgi:cell division protease FtsH
MSERLGNVAYERDGRGFLAGQEGGFGPRERDYGEETGNTIDAEVRKIVDGVLERTLNLLRERRDALERSARRLLEKETLDEAELLEFAGRGAAQAAAAERQPAAAE